MEILLYDKISGKNPERVPLQAMIESATHTAERLKLIANPLRLVVLCSLVESSKNVTELIEMTGVSQTLMSNHLAVLRKAGIIDYQRNHRVLNYYLKDENMKQVLNSLHQIYCP